jgi:phage terminase large subunit-like protein
LELINHYKSLETTLLEKMVDGLSDEPIETWEQFKTPSDPVAWIEKHFRIPETPDHRIILYPYQKFVISNALLKENDRYKYSIILYSDIKKSAKSSLSAGVALYIAFTKPWASIRLVANDLKQADSRQMEYARRCIALNPEMAKICKVSISGYKIEFPNHSKIEAVAIDPKGEAGGNDDAIFYSELWGMQSKASLKMWTEMALSPTKFGQSFIWCESYAGFSGESPLLEQLYDQGVKNGSSIKGVEQFDPPLEAFENQSAGLFSLWNTVPRLPWQTPEYYASEASRLTDSEFLRMHRNQWGSSEQAFIPLEWWNACKGDFPPLEENESVVVACDAGIESDCFAVVMVSGFMDGTYAVRYARKWEPKALGHKVHFRTPEKDGPEDELRRLVEVYNVIEMAYDPYQLADLAERFSSEMVANMTAFSQAGPRLIADKQLYDMIRDRSIWHSGDPDLAEHVGNANRRIEGDSGKLRIVKRSQVMKIDLAVALSMAVDRARAWGL